MTDAPSLRFCSALLGTLFLLPACGSAENSTKTSIPLVSGDITTVIGTGQNATDPVYDAQGNPNGVDPLHARLDQPLDVSFSADGALYVLDWNSHKIRSIHDDGLLYPFAGTGIEGDACESGYDMGACPVLQAELNHPTDITFSADGNAWIAAWHNAKIKTVDMTTSMLHDACGSGTRDYLGDGGPCFGPGGAQLVALDLPSSVVFDSAGNLFISDQSNQVIRRIGTDGIVTTVAGSCPKGGFGCPGGEGYVGDGGPATAAMLDNQVGQAALPDGKIAFDGAGELYIADTYNHVVRRVLPGSDGVLGSGDPSEEIIDTVVGTGVQGFSGDGGPAKNAQLTYPTDVAFAPDGTLYIADRGAHCVRRVDTQQVITTAAGQCGTSGSTGDGAAATLALLDSPFGVAVDASGALFIADTLNYRIRKVLP
jgi:sugar lactone lactonase YvrE